jgi:AcrR family transcriptional regulator
MILLLRNSQKWGLQYQRKQICFAETNIVRFQQPFFTFGKARTSSALHSLNQNVHSMQTQKDDIRKNILAIARTEFIKKGFKDASMRMIAKKAGVGLSNIYNYFKNKDEIFCEVLSGLLMAIDQVTEEHNSPENIDLYVFNSDEYIHSQIHMFVELIDHYQEDFRLLLFKASGSSLENYRDDITDRHTETGKEYIRKMKEKYPSVNADISVFFIHTMSSWWISIIVELVSHDLSHDELERFIGEYMEFGTAGWKKIMGLKD